MQVGAIFGIIFAIIVMVFLLGGGVSMLQDMFCLGSIAQVNSAVQEFERMAKHIRDSGLDSRNVYRLSLPGGARICFIDPEDPGPNFLGEWNPDPSLHIEDEIMAKGYTLWIEYNCGSASMDGKASPYIYEEGNFCAESGDRVMLTNKGVDVLVEMYEGQA
jgi:hypothetical protein